MAARRYEIYPFYYIHLWRFPEDFRLLSEDFRRFSEISPKARRMFRNNFRKFPKIAGDAGPKNIRRSFDHTQTNLSVVKGTKKIIFPKSDIFTCEDIISFLSI